MNEVKKNYGEPLLQGEDHFIKGESIQDRPLFPELTDTLKDELLLQEKQLIELYIGLAKFRTSSAARPDAFGRSEQIERKEPGRLSVESELRDLLELTRRNNELAGQLIKHLRTVIE